MKLILFICLIVGLFAVNSVVHAWDVGGTTPVQAQTNAAKDAVAKKYNGVKLNLNRWKFAKKNQLKGEQGKPARVPATK